MILCVKGALVGVMLNDLVKMHRIKCQNLYSGN